MLSPAAPSAQVHRFDFHPFKAAIPRLVARRDLGLACASAVGAYAATSRTGRAARNLVVQLLIKTRRVHSDRGIPTCERQQLII